MSNQVIKENFTGKYDGVTPAPLLKYGSVSDGLNMRKISPVGGWKVRKGCTLHNTTAVDSTNDINSMHLYENPINNDRHFLVQCNSKLYKSPQDPPTVAADTTWTDLGVTVGTGNAFSCVVNEAFFYADGSGVPITYGGSTPKPIGVFIYDNSSGVYNDFTEEVTDNNTATVAKVLSATDDKIYIITSEIAEGFTFDLGTAVNNNAATMTVKSWQAGSWSSRSATDNTASGSASMAVDGTITWTRSASDTMRVIANTMGYAYEISWSAAIDATDLISVTVTQDPTAVTNKWNSYWENIAGARFFDASVDGGRFVEELGDVSNEAQSMYMDISAMQVEDFIYIKAVEPIAGVGFAISSGYPNTNDAQIDQMDYWNGSAWTAVTSGLIDTTLDGTGDSSFNQTGKVFWNAAAITPYPRELEGDPIPGYWYRFSVDAALSTDVRVYYIVYAPHPADFPTVTGVFEFKSRLTFWTPKVPNRLGLTARRKGDCFSGLDAGYSEPFGGEDAILYATNFYNEALVFKRNSMYFLEGFDQGTFGILRISTTVGLASPKTVHVIEVGVPGMHEDEPMSIAIWQAHDGVYVLDGRKPRKVSMPVDHYFNPEYSTCIPAANIESLEAVIDKNNNEYHLLLPTAELVYNYATDEWYPPWERAEDLVCGLSFKGSDNRYYSYAGDADGFVHHLEDDTTDKDNSLSNLITNGSAWTGATGATPPTGWAVETAGTFTITDSGDGAPYDACLTIEVDGTPTANPGINYSITTEVGKSYKFSFAFKKGSATSGAVYIGTATDDDLYFSESYTDAAWATDTVEFEATTTTTEVWLRTISAVATQTSLFDTVTFHQVADVAISHSLKTRAIPATQEKDWERPLGTTYDFTLRRLWAEFKAQTAGSVTVKTFKNMATSGTTQAVPEAMSMINTGYSMAIPKLDMSITGCSNFQAEFSLAVVDQEIEIWSFIYEIEIVGAIK